MISISQTAEIFETQHHQLGTFPRNIKWKCEIFASLIAVDGWLLRTFV